MDEATEFARLHARPVVLARAPLPAAILGGAGPLSAGWLSACCHNGMAGPQGEWLASACPTGRARALNPAPALEAPGGAIPRGCLPASRGGVSGKPSSLPGVS